MECYKCNGLMLPYQEIDPLSKSQWVMLYRCVNCSEQADSLTILNKFYPPEPIEEKRNKYK